MHAQPVGPRGCMLAATPFGFSTSCDAVGKRVVDDSAGFECVATASPSSKHSQMHFTTASQQAFDGSAQNVVHAQSVRRRACMLVTTELRLLTSSQGVGMRDMDDSTGFECVATAFPSSKHSQMHLRQHLSRPLMAPR